MCCGLRFVSSHRLRNTYQPNRARAWVCLWGTGICTSPRLWVAPPTLLYAGWKSFLVFRRALSSSMAQVRISSPWDFQSRAGPCNASSSAFQQTPTGLQGAAGLEPLNGWQTGPPALRAQMGALQPSTRFCKGPLLACSVNAFIYKNM